MINESFSWWSGSLYISKSHIKNMKKNMRKVPIIQIKSDIYHKKEDVEAENIISSIDKESTTSIVIDVNNRNKTENTSWFEKLIIKLKNLFWKQHNNVQ